MDYQQSVRVIGEECVPEKLDKLTPQQVRLVENIIDECIALYNCKK